MARNISSNMLQLFRNAFNLNDDDEQDVLIDLQVGKKVFHGVEKKMRSELWLSILHRKGIGIAAAKKFQYYLRQVVIIPRILQSPQLLELATVRRGQCMACLWVVKTL